MKNCLLLMSISLWLPLAANANQDFGRSNSVSRLKLATLVAPTVANTCVAKGDRCTYHSDCCEHMSCSYDWNLVTYTCQ